jgi:3-deoxy-D-manno-octulosonate 8-phosphate phosphatase (KDO 8-P phosphatase)
MDVDGVLSDGRLYYGPEGEAMKAFDARDGLGLTLLLEAGVRLAIVSGRESPVVATRARDLRVDPCLMGRMDKAVALREIAARWGLELSSIAAIGDDLVDIPMLALCGWGMCPAGADPRLRARADRVLRARGGRGAVREACELILHARGDWERVRRRFQLDQDDATRSGGGR